MKKNLSLVLLLIILLAASYFRILGTFTNSFAFTYDVGRDMLRVSEIINAHKIPLIGFTTGVEGIFYGPWWYYILAVPFFLSGGDPQFIAGFIALTGIVTIILLYVLGRQIGDNKLGLVLAFLAAFSPALIGLSTQIWNPNIAPILITISLLLINKILKNPSSLAFFFFGIISSLLIDTEIVFGLLLFISNCVGLFLLSRKTIITKKVLFFIPGVLIILAPRIIFEFRHQFLMTSTLIRLFNVQKEASKAITLQSIMDKLNIFFGLYADTLTNGSKIIAGILLLILLGCLIVYYRKIAHPAKQFLLLSLIIIVTFMVGIIGFSHDIWSHYLVGLPVYFCLFTGILLYYSAKNIKLGSAGLLFILTVLIWINVKPAQILADLGKPIWEGDAAVYRNQVAVVDYVYKQASGRNFEFTAYSPAVFAYPYDYLFAWYGEKKYHYSPTKQHQELFFVIIEPDLQRPALLRNWLKMREKDGKIVKEEKVKGGVIVQTREH